MAALAVGRETRAAEIVAEREVLTVEMAVERETRTVEIAIQVVEMEGQRNEMEVQVVAM